MTSRAWPASTSPEQQELRQAFQAVQDSVLGSALHERLLAEHAALEAAARAEPL